jgi:NADH-quinone oxidoreductase subunit B
MAVKTPRKTPARKTLKDSPEPAVTELAVSSAQANTMLTTPPPDQIVIPDAASDDPLLAEFGMEAHPQGGFHGLLEVIPTKADYILDLIRANSLWPLLSGLSCCAIEMMSTATPMNDMDRFGMFPMRASPRQADVLIVAGTLTTKMAGPLVRLWAQMPEPKWCVAMGTCTTSGGRFKRSYSVVQGVDRVMPVDVYVPGCRLARRADLRMIQLPVKRGGEVVDLCRPRAGLRSWEDDALTTPAAAGPLVGC